MGTPNTRDSSDIHKPLYGPLKRAGLVRSGNKTFALTARGVEEANKLTPASEASGSGADRLTRDMQLELDRMLGSDAFKLFGEGQGDRILDTRFLLLSRMQRAHGPERLYRADAGVRGDDRQSAGTLASRARTWRKELSDLWKHMRQRFADLIKRREASR